MRLPCARLISSSSSLPSSSFHENIVIRHFISFRMRFRVYKFKWIFPHRCTLVFHFKLHNSVPTPAHNSNTQTRKKVIRPTYSLFSMEIAVKIVKKKTVFHFLMLENGKNGNLNEDKTPATSSSLSFRVSNGSFIIY